MAHIKKLELPFYYYKLGLYWPFLFSLTGSFTLSQAIFAILFSFAAFLLVCSFPYGELFKSISYASILAFILFCLSILTYSTELRALSDSSRLIFFIFYFSVGYIYSLNGGSEQELIKVFINFCVISVVFSFLVFIPSLHFIVDLFKGRLSDDFLQFHFLRFSGFSGFPTDLGAVLVLGLSMLLNINKSTIFSRGKILIVFTVIFIGLVGTVSRGAFLQLFFVLLFFCLSKTLRALVKLKLNRYLLSFILLTVLLIPIMILISIYLPDHPIVGYLSVDFSAPDASVLHRFIEVQGAVDVLFDKGFLYGTDRDFPLGLPVIEGFWTHWILRYSWLGLILFLCIGIYFIYFMNKSNSIIGKSLSLWLSSFLCSAAFFSDVLFRFKGPLIYGFMFGFCYYLHKNKRRIILTRSNVQKSTFQDEH